MSGYLLNYSGNNLFLSLLERKQGEGIEMEKRGVYTEITSKVKVNFPGKEENKKGKHNWF